MGRRKKRQKARSVYISNGRRKETEGENADRKEGRNGRKEMKGRHGKSKRIEGEGDRKKQKGEEGPRRKLGRRTIEEGKRWIEWKERKKKRRRKIDKKKRGKGE